MIFGLEHVREKGGAQKGGGASVSEARGVPSPQEMETKKRLVTQRARPRWPGALTPLYLFADPVPLPLSCLSLPSSFFYYRFLLPFATHRLREIYLPITPAMVAAVFRRTLSFPNGGLSRQSKPAKAYHVRSISLPCRPHPLISQLKDEIKELRAWEWNHGGRTSAWLCEGLNLLRTVHNSLDDILQLPQTQELLRRQPAAVEKLLEDFLGFVDVYGLFRTSVLALKEEQLSAQVAIRRKDESKVALFVKAQRKMNKEMSKLVSTVRCAGQFPDGEGELISIVRDVNQVTVLVSLALFHGVSSSWASRKFSWKGLRLSKKAKRVKREECIQEFQQVGMDIFWGLKKKGDEEVRIGLKLMHALESCLAGIELCSERVFRSLISTRVSLLNILTQ